MCQFFSVVSDGKGKVMFFKVEDVARIMAEGNKEGYEFNSHSSIAKFFGVKAMDEDKLNFWEYDTDKKELKEDIIKTRNDGVDVLMEVEAYLKDKDVGWLRNIYNYNSGHCNSGDRNSGDRNSGDRNSGDYNSGHRNSGNYNSGDYNSGNYNSGHYNSGHRNSGHYNSGHYNSGDYNSGNYNSGHCNSGIFNSLTPPFLMFNKKSNWTTEKWYNSKACNILFSFSLTDWINEDKMSEQEKKDRPEHKTQGGYLKKFTYQEAWTNLWAKLSEADKKEIYKLPNFNKKVFREITGIKV